MNIDELDTKVKQAAIKRRLLVFCTDKMQMNVRTFAKQLGVDESYFSTFTGNPSRKVREKFSQRCPALNLDWLITGEGEMINKDADGNELPLYPNTVITDVSNSKVVNGDGNHLVTINPTSQDGDLVSYLKEQIKQKDKIIEMLYQKLCDLAAPCK